MRALVLEEFGRLRLAERPDPEIGPDDVLIKVVATGICGTDVHGYTGENGRRVPGQVMGHETVGRIAGLGADVTGLAEGAVVTFNPVVLPPSERERYAGREQHCPDKYVIGVRADVSAAFAEYVAVPAANVVVLPPGMPVSSGALIEPLAVAVHAVRRVAPRPGENVVVLGGGPIGQSLVLALGMIGVDSVLVSEPSPTRRRLLDQLGAHTVDPSAGSIGDQVRSWCGAAADVALDAVGVQATLTDALQATTSGGRIALVGMGSTQLSFDAYRISVDERTLVGSFTYSDSDFRTAADWIGAAPAVAELLISREVTPEQADAAFRGLADGDGTPGKVLVRMDQVTHDEDEQENDHAQR